jgi:hypothetical protein
MSSDIPESQAPNDPRQWGVGRGKPLLLNLDLNCLSRVLFQRCPVPKYLVEV